MSLEDAITLKKYTSSHPFLNSHQLWIPQTMTSSGLCKTLASLQT